MASAPPDPNALVCNSCHALNPPGARFCAVCGGQSLAMVGQFAGPPPLAPAPVYGAPPMPPPMMPPVYPPAYPTQPAPAAGAVLRPPVVLPLPADQAWSHALGALQAAGCQITGQSPPVSAAFRKGLNSFWKTSGTTINYDGTITVTPEGPAQSQVTVQLAVDKGSLMPLIAMQLVAAAIVGLFTFGWLIGLLIGGIGVYMIYQRAGGKFLNQELDSIIAQLGGAAGHGAPPPNMMPAPPQGYSPPPQGYPPAPPGYPPAPPMQPPSGYTPPPFTPGR